MAKKSNLQAKTKIIGPIINFLFPQSCFVCREPGKPICSECIKSFAPAKLRCLKCGRANPFGLYCKSCHSKSKANLVLAGFDYKNPITSLIHQFKYEDVTSLSDPFCDCLAALLSKIPDNLEYKICYIPLTLKKLKLRGYNQSKLLAEGIGQCLNVTVTGLLTRVEARESQVIAQSRKLRKTNIKGAFSIKSGAEIPQKVILLDDVITTGATVEEAVKVLKAAGVKEVIVLALALD
jgi:ComF family protein